MAISWEEPDWDAPSGVHARFMHRCGGASLPPYDSFNLAFHVGDNEISVRKNRSLLGAELHLPADPIWTKQVHSNRVLDVSLAMGISSAVALSNAPMEEADGTYTSLAGVVLVMMVADCLPILLANDSGDELAVLHAGWRGLASGVIGKGIEKFKSRVTHAWVGPGIGPCHFEVDIPVTDHFKGYSDTVLKGRDENHWFLNLGRIAESQLRDFDVPDIAISKSCTWCDEDRYFSARRDVQSGRMACLIWRE
ncbi:MAG: peptidoglycan editing factor PgeF [Pseudomonadales bacterium]|jgi:YfiH family protein